MASPLTDEDLPIVVRAIEGGYFDDLCRKQPELGRGKAKYLPLGLPQKGAFVSRLGELLGREVDAMMHAEPKGSPIRKAFWDAVSERRKRLLRER